MKDFVDHPAHRARRRARRRAAGLAGAAGAAPALDHRAHLRAARGHRAGRARRHRRRRAGHVHLRARPRCAAHRGRARRRGEPRASALWLGRRLAAEAMWADEVRLSGSGRWRRAAASWSPGSRTTCARRWPACGRWPRRWRTAWSATRRRSPTTTAGSGSETDRMASLVDDLFELSRINAGALRLTLDAVSLGDVVSDAVASAAPVAAARGVRLVAAETGWPTVQGSEPELSRVVANLLRNAIRHTPSDGTVTLTGGQDDAGRLARGDRRVRRHPGGRPAPRLRRGVPGRPARTPATTDGRGWRWRAGPGDRARPGRGAPRRGGGEQCGRWVPVRGPACRLSVRRLGQAVGQRRCRRGRAGTTQSASRRAARRRRREAGRAAAPCSRRRPGTPPPG